MFFGAVIWDPSLIIAQIICLQCLYYLTLGVFLSVLVGTRVSRMSLVYFFDFATVTPSTVTGWCVIASFVLSAFSGAGYMVYLIERAKKCLDFSATLFTIHLLICITYGDWPASVTWWVVNGIGLVVMALLGEHLCIRRELKEIPINRYRTDQMFDEEVDRYGPGQGSTPRAISDLIDLRLRSGRIFFRVSTLSTYGDGGTRAQ